MHHSFAFAAIAFSSVAILAFSAPVDPKNRKGAGDRGPDVPPVIGSMNTVPFPLQEPQVRRPGSLLDNEVDSSQLVYKGVQKAAPLAAGLARAPAQMHQSTPNVIDVTSQADPIPVAVGSADSEKFPIGHQSSRRPISGSPYSSRPPRPHSSAPPLTGGNHPSSALRGSGSMQPPNVLGNNPYSHADLRFPPIDPHAGINGQAGSSLPWLLEHLQVDSQQGPYQRVSGMNPATHFASGDLRTPRPAPVQPPNTGRFDPPRGMLPAGNSRLPFSPSAPLSETPRPPKLSLAPAQDTPMILASGHGSSMISNSIKPPHGPVGAPSARGAHAAPANRMEPVAHTYTYAPTDELPLLANVALGDARAEAPLPPLPVYEQRPPPRKAPPAGGVRLRPGQAGHSATGPVPKPGAVEPFPHGPRTRFHYSLDKLVKTKIEVEVPEMGRARATSLWEQVFPHLTDALVNDPKFRHKFPQRFINQVKKFATDGTPYPRDDRVMETMSEVLGTPISLRPTAL